MDWKELLASQFTAEQLAEGAAENAADAAARHDEDKRACRLGTLRLEYEKKGRKGKPCTIISGFQGSEDELVRLKRLLQTRLATGGSHCFSTEPPYDGQILLQGDCRTTASPLLQQEGYKVTHN